MLIKRNTVETAIIVAALLGLAIPRARAGVAFNENIPVSGTSSDPCTGHATEFSGTFHLVVAITNSSNGGFHIVFRDNFENAT